MDTISKETHKYIKNVIGTYKDYYNDEDLLCSVDELVSLIKDKHDIDNGDTKHVISHYLHYSSQENKHYFNTRKKQPSQKQAYYNEMIQNNIVEPITKKKRTEFVFAENENESFIAIKGSTSKTTSTDWGFNDDDDDDDEEIDQCLTNNYTSVDDFKEIINETITQNEIDDLEAEFENDVMYGNTRISKYILPSENAYTITKKNDEANGPYGTQWIHDIQRDDVWDNELKLRAIAYDKLRAIILPEQRSKEWFDMREMKITASDGGTVIGQNKHEPQFEFIIKKVVGREFTSNKFCYHGKKLEEIATMIYRYRMNTQVDDFGLMGHPEYSFLGASPDGICTRYKLDGKHKSKFVGRMLEIKCPFVRKIQTSGEIKDHICPIYYWVQVQLQLECCKLEECDFWQCKLDEYESRQEFINDTDEREPFRSLSFGREKGVLIQLLPLKSLQTINEKGYLQTIYEDASFIYPPKIEMSPYDVDIWVSETTSKLKQTHPDSYLDKVIYWRLEQSHNVTIMRDRDWFNENLPKFEKMWNYVLFLRKNKDRTQLMMNYIKSRSKKMNADIMNVIDKLCNTSKSEYPAYKLYLENSIKLGEEQKIKKIQEKKANDPMNHFNTSSCMFDDE